MKGFIAGVLVTIFVPLVAAFCFFKLGLMAVNADAPPGWLERRIANMSLDAAVHRNAPQQENPIAVNDENLIKGVKLYKENCSGCHGGPDGPSDFGLSFYPPAPQFKRSFGAPDGNIFYIVKHGVRLTGMPAFGGEMHTQLKDDQIWTLVRFLKNMQSLPPAAEAAWKAQPTPAASPSASPSSSPGAGASASPTAAPSSAATAGPAPQSTASKSPKDSGIDAPSDDDK